MASGKVIDGLNPDFYVDLTGNENLQIGNMVLFVDTSIARNIYLPKIATTNAKFGVGTIHVYIIDTTGNAATNNITVYPNASNQINTNALGVPIVINSNYDVVDALIITATKWTTANYNGGGGGGSVSMTYAQLITNIGLSNLVTGQSILLTDYATATYIQFSGALGFEQIHVGTTEPLLLTATSSNTLSNVAQSILYPQDSITYLPVMADRDYDYAASAGKGCIIARRDNSLELYRDFDFRNVIFRRWETVNGSGNFDSITDTGFASQDYPPFPVGTSTKTSIGSPLFLASGFGLPYALDNTVATGNCVGNTIFLGFGNTITTNFENNVVYFLVDNYCASLYANDGLVMISNSHINMNIDGNKFNSITDNQIDGTISFNFTKQIEGNVAITTSGNLITENNCFEITSNTNFVSIIKNNCIMLNDNVRCYVIDSNTVTNINNNTNIDNIVLNVGISIDLNTAVLNRVNNIVNNNVGFISTNNLGVFDITNNTGNQFNQNNLVAGGTVDNCIFQRINFCIITGSRGIVNNNFIASIASKTFTPTASMAANVLTFTTFDVTNFDVEQILNAGVLIYVAF